MISFTKNKKLDIQRNKSFKLFNPSLKHMFFSTKELHLNS